MSIALIEEAIESITNKVDHINIEGLTASPDSEVPTYNANGITEIPNTTLKTINIFGATDSANWDDSCKSCNIGGLTDEDEANYSYPWLQAYGIEGIDVHPFLQASYDYPIAELGRNLPALIIIYDGFSQRKEAIKQSGAVYRFECTLYFSADGRTLELPWRNMKLIMQVVMNRFRMKPDLMGTCWGSSVASGESIIMKDSNGRPDYIGHTFIIEANKTEGE